ISPDGSTLYFVSNRPTATHPAKKDFDLWRVRKAGGAWSAPEHLGDALNSEKQEFGPELHDGWLWFNSNRDGGAGKLDIYRAKLLADGTFGAAENVGAPVNTPLDECDPVLTRDGMTLFLSIRQ